MFILNLSTHSGRVGLSYILVCRPTSLYLLPIIADGNWRSPDSRVHNALQIVIVNNTICSQKAIPRLKLMTDKYFKCKVCVAATARQIKG